MKKTKSVLSCILILTISLYITMFYFEEKIIFAGTKHSDSYRDATIPTISKLNFEHKFLNHKNTSIEYFSRYKNSKENILFLGGNAEDVLFDLSFLSNTFKHQNIYTLNYPGYGGSNGISNEDRITELVNDFIIQLGLDKNNLTVVGRSLGTGFATKVASTFKNTKSLILVSPYYSMEKLAVEHFPFMPYGMTSLFMKNKIETFKHAKLLNIPVLVIYAKNDNVVFNNHTEKLIDLFHQKEVVLIENETHDSVLMATKTIESIQKFIPLAP